MRWKCCFLSPPFGNRQAAFELNGGSKFRFRSGRLPRRPVMVKSISIQTGRHGSLPLLFWGKIFHYDTCSRFCSGRLPRRPALRNKSGLPQMKNRLRQPLVFFRLRLLCLIIRLCCQSRCLINSHPIILRIDCYAGVHAVNIAVTVEVGSFNFCRVDKRVIRCYLVFIIIDYTGINTVDIAISVDISKKHNCIAVNNFTVSFQVDYRLCSKTVAGFGILKRTSAVR